MDEELKPCPFCGGEAKLVKRHNSDNRADYYFVECRKCMTRGHLRLKNGKEKAIKAWNARERGKE